MDRTVTATASTAGQAHNPLVPATYDVVWSIVALAVVIAVVVTVVVLVRAAVRASRGRPAADGTTIEYSGEVDTIDTVDSTRPDASRRRLGRGASRPTGRGTRR